MLVFTDIDAVNDDSFNHKRHRTSAISESVASIANYPTKLRIYLTNASPFWQVRCFIKGRTHTKSLRTTSRRVAVRAAKLKTSFTEQLLISTAAPPESKKHDKPIVTLQGAVFVYEKLLEHHKKTKLAEPTDYLFMPTLRDRTHLLLYLGWQFMYVQKLAKIEKNASNGMNRTLYSLRYTAITFRLLYGGNIDLLTHSVF